MALILESPENPDKMGFLELTFSDMIYTVIVNHINPAVGRSEIMT